MADKKWEGTTFGNSLMHKWLIKLLQVIDIRMVYIFTYVFVIPPCLFRPGFKHIYHYFRQRWGYGPIRSFLKTYQNHCMFSQVVIDRFAKYAGKRFEVRIEGYEHFQHLSNQKEAFIQLSSHIGNYEMAGYTLTSKEKTINALVFFGEKESVMKSRGEMFSDKNIKMIPVKEDMSHLFIIDQAIGRGEIISMPADRVFGSPKTVDVNLLGAKASLPLGPFNLAAIRKLNVLAINVMKISWNAYNIYVTPLHYDTNAPRKQQIEELSSAYAAETERILKLHPAQWYNFYNFWES